MGIHVGYTVKRHDRPGVGKVVSTVPSDPHGDPHLARVRWEDGTETVEYARELVDGREGKGGASPTEPISTEWAPEAAFRLPTEYSKPIPTPGRELGYLAAGCEAPTLAAWLAGVGEAPESYPDLELLRYLHQIGHPDELEIAAGVVARPMNERDLLLKHDLRAKAEAARRVLGVLTERGWAWRWEGPGVGHAERTTGRKGGQPHWTSWYIWQACQAIEAAKREATGRPDAPWVAYRVKNDQTDRQRIRETLSGFLAAESLTEDALRKAVGSYRKRGGQPPP